MYKTVKVYYDFLKEQEKQREEKLSLVKDQVNDEMDMFMSEHGWVRKGKGKKVNYTKKFNGKDIVIEFRCNYNKDYDAGLPEFIHHKSITGNLNLERVEIVQLRYFHWNNQVSSDRRLDVIMERMEKFYDNYTK